ncbi:MAG: hypothetical protein ABTQ31_10185 [Rhizobiaceae bacterium]
MIHTQPIRPAAVQAPVRSRLEQMADKLRELGATGGVDEQTLFENSDFTRAEIRELGLAASDLARARAVRQVA